MGTRRRDRYATEGGRGDAVVGAAVSCRPRAGRSGWRRRAPLWEHAGTITLKAAGLETVALAEARNTWFEILGQSLGVMARSHRRGVRARSHVRRPEWSALPIREVGGLGVGHDAVSRRSSCRRWPLRLAPRLLSLLAAPPESGAGAARTGACSRPPSAASEATSLPRSRTMELLLDVDLPVSISFGKTQVPLKDVLKLTTGSIVELNRGVNDQVEVLVNQCLIARGEVVVVEGNYGVRIQEIASRQDRLAEPAMSAMPAAS